ncbi:MAG: aspartate kinase [Pseudobdellovibrionaceae bacterium]
MNRPTSPSQPRANTPIAPANVIVKKYGGTSVGTLERIENVAARLSEEIKLGQKPIVVASAMSGETNRLIGLGDTIDPQYRGPAYDMLVASGEQVSIALLAIALNKKGIQAQPLLGYQLGIQTDSTSSKARIQKINGQMLLDLTEKNIVPVVAGFQGVDESLNITTLGRGGSDTSAVAIAAAIGARECEIYTDVPAVFTADPRLVPRAKELSYIPYDEMMEMAALGSKVLHIRSVEMAAKYNIRIHLRSTFETRAGTWIVPEGEVMEQVVVSSVTHDANTFVFKLFPVPQGPQFLADLFDRLAARGIVVDIITQSEQQEGQRLAFSVTKEDLPLTEQVLKETLGKDVLVTVMPNMAKVSVVGMGMRNHPGVAARFFKVLAKQQVPVHLVTTSEIKISAVIDPEHLASVASTLHSEFSLDRT